LPKNRYFFNFFDFSPKAQGPLKIFDTQFSKIFKKNSKNGSLGTSQALTEKVLVRLSLSLWTQQMDLDLGGMI